jgi:hypothetical protein
MGCLNVLHWYIRSTITRQLLETNRLQADDDDARDGHVVSP